jgi:hypothetical protein
MHGVALPPYKAGRKRHTLDVTTCCLPLLYWIVTLWSGTPLALALDATSAGARVVLQMWTLVLPPFMTWSV